MIYIVYQKKINFKVVYLTYMASKLKNNIFIYTIKNKST